MHDFESLNFQYVLIELTYTYKIVGMLLRTMAIFILVMQILAFS